MVVGISASGRTPYVISALTYANQLEAKTVALSCNVNSDISQLADYALEVNVGPEVLTGSTRLKAGTSQKIVLNMISTMTMIGIGKVYDNLMVDLKPTNTKLQQRSIHIIEDICSIDHETAQHLYQQANNDIKVAVVMHMCDTSRNDAQLRLTKHNGVIKKRFNLKEAFLMKNEQQLAEQILHAVGGIENINDILHCMTRIRLKLNNKQHVNYTELKSIKGVLGVIDDDRLQIVLGPGVVDKVTEYIEKQHKTTSSPAQPTENKQHKNSNKRWNKVLRTIADIFIPLIPAFVGAGLIGGIAAVLNNFIQAGDLTADWVKQMVVVLNVIKDGMFFYLAIYTGINAAKVFGATPGLGGVIGGTTLLTGISDKNPIVNILLGSHFYLVKVVLLVLSLLSGYSV